MDKSQFDRLAEKEEETTIRPGELKDQSDRLLVDGYDTDRQTYQLYLEDGQFVLRFYGYEDIDLAPVAWRTVDGEAVEVTRLYPNKRIYPETTDFEFVRLLLRRGGTPSLTPWDQARYDRKHS